MAPASRLRGGRRSGAAGGRRLRLVAVLVALACLAAACGNSDDGGTQAAPDTATDSGSTTSRAGEPAAEGPAEEAEAQTIRIGVASLQEQFPDPHLTVGGLLFPLRWAISEGLYRQDLNAEWVPALAESYEVSEDQLTWTFALRDDVTMHDGSDFTANDVKTAIDRVLGSDDFAHFAVFRATVTGATVIDDHTIQITTNRPYATLLGDIPVPIPTNYYDSVGEEGFRANPMAAGAWKFVEQELNVSVTYERFDDFYDPERKNNFSRLIFEIIPDESSRVAGMRTGSLDIAVGVTPLAAEQLRTTPNVQILESEDTAQADVFMIDNRFPEEGSLLQDVRVRRALLMAIDRQGIADSLYRGFAKVPNGGLSPITLGYDESLEPVPYDPEGAQALLEEAGAGNLAFTLHSYSTTASVPDVSKMAEAVAGYWQQIGVDVTLNIRDANSYLPEFRSRSLRGAGILSSPSQFFTEPSQYQTFYGTDGAYSSLSDPAMEDLLTRIGSTVDIDERAALGRELSDVLSEQLYALPIVLVSSLMAVGPNIESWEMMRGSPYAGPLWYLRAK